MLVGERIAEAEDVVLQEVRFRHPWRDTALHPLLLPVEERAAAGTGTVQANGEFTDPEEQLEGREQSPHVDAMYPLTGAEVVQVGLGLDLDLLLAVLDVVVIRGVAVVDAAAVLGMYPVAAGIVAAAVEVIDAVGAAVRVARAVRTAAAVQARSVGAGAVTVPAAMAARQPRGTASVHGPSLGLRGAIPAAAASAAVLDAALVAVSVAVAA